MKHLGSARIRGANRVVLPEEVVSALEAKQGDEVQFWKDEKKIIIVLPIAPCVEG